MAGTAPDIANVPEYAINAVWTAPYSAPLPTGPLPLSYPSAGTIWSMFGHLSSEGITEERGTSNTKEYSSTGAKVFDADAQLDESFTIICNEMNPVVANLSKPGAVQTVATAGTAEQQLITVSATGGTFTPQYGQALGSAVTYTTSTTNTAVQTAIQAIPALSTATVTGSAGGPYTVTFPVAEGNAPLLAFANALTGGSQSVVASETVAGTFATYKWVTAASGVLTPSLRYFAVDRGSKGRFTRTLFAGIARATALPASTKGTLGKTTFVISKLEDVFLGQETILSTDPAYKPGSFA